MFDKAPAQGLGWSRHFHYCRVIGKLNFLMKSLCPDISVDVHQCIWFQNSPNQSHIQAVQNDWMVSQRQEGQGHNTKTQLGENL